MSRQATGRHATVPSSRRAAEHASARNTSSPRPHRPRGPFQTALRECGVPISPCSAFRLFSTPAHSRAWPFATGRATQVCRRKVKAQPAQQRLKSHRPRAISPSDRYGQVRAVHGSPSDVVAYQRAVRRRTRSPVARRLTRATHDVQAAPGVLHVGQPAPKTPSKASHETRDLQQARGVPGVDERSTSRPHAAQCHFKARWLRQESP